MTLKQIDPKKIYPRKRPTGPPFLKEFAVPKNRPVPITPGQTPR